MSDEYMTIAAAASYLGRSISTVRTLVDTGRLPHVVDMRAKQRQGRRVIPRAAVEEYAEKRGITPLDNR